MSLLSKSLIALAIVAVALVFPLTAKFRPAKEIVAQTDAFDASKVYEFGGKGFFKSSARVTKMELKTAEVEKNDRQLPEAFIDEWIEEDDSDLITPAYAHAQAKRISEENHLSLNEVNTLIDEHTDTHVLGADTVNVKELNLAIVKRQNEIR